MKKNLFLITEEEKRRILGLHQSATKRGYLSEQEQTVQYYKDQTGKIIKLVGNYSAPLGSTPATPEEYDAQNKPVEGGGGQGAKVITNNDRSYDYKEENGKYYYSKKGQNQWVEAKGDINDPKSSLGAIKNLKWDTATPMPSPTNPTPGTSGVQGTSGVAGTSGVQGTSGVAGTSGVQGTSGVAGTSVAQGQPVYYPWVKEGGTPVQNIIDSHKADSNFQSWLTELKKLTKEQLEKVKTDLNSAFLESAIGVKLDSTEAYYPFRVAQSTINDAIVMAEDLKKATETNGVAGTSGVQGTSGVKLLDRVPTNKEIRQGFRRRKRINNRMDRQKRKQLDDLYNQYEKIGGSIQKFASRDDGSPEFKQQMATLENQIKNINAQIDKLEST